MATVGTVYVPRHFAEDDAEVVAALVRAAGFGHLVAVGDAGLTSTPMPFLVDDELTSLRGHLARANPFWSVAPAEAMCIVPVSDAYVSPGWYPSKAEHGKVVPTWNYEVVHVRGELVIHDDGEWLASLVRELTDLHEHERPAPWSVDDPPPGFVDNLLRAIVGLELRVERVEAKRKLSQNRPAADALGVVRGLRVEGEHRGAAVADAMDGG